MTLIKVYVVKSKVAKFFIFRYNAKANSFVYFVLILLLKS
nr:MAG TPA: hypothetical protein [Bacteriophage sp.]